MTGSGGDDLAAFKRDLRDLRAAVGQPSDGWFRRAPHGLARSTLNDLLKGPSRPRWLTLETFLHACEEYARSDRGTWPGRALERNAWLERWMRLPRTPAPVDHDGPPPPAEERRWIGVVPHPAGSYQDRGLAAAFSAPGPRQHVLSGLGGVGKTQVATRLARQLWDAGEIDELIWVQAGARHRILDAYRLAWARIGDDDEDGDPAARLLEWLETTDRRWLVVLDDLADPADLRGLWPPATETGRTVVTTRRTDASLTTDGREMLRLASFGPSAASAYVHAKLAARPQLAAGAEELVAELGGLPLALSQAVVHQLDVDWTCSDYLDQLRRLPLREAAPETLPDDQTAAVAATLALSLRHADGLRPAGLATPVLRVAALLDPDGIPETVFTTAAVTSALGIGADDARSALRCLRRVSLVDIDQIDHGRVRVHSLVQRVTREDTPAEVLTGLRRVCAEALLEIWPGAGDDPEQRARFHANASALMDDSLLAGGVHRLVFETARSMAAAGGIEAAIDHLAGAAKRAATVLGADHPDVLRLRHEEMYRRGVAEYYDVAAEMAASLIEDWQRVRGPGDPLALDARIYHARWLGHERPEAAIPLLGALIAELGAGHAEAPTVRNDLAYFRGRAGDPAGAAEEFGLLVRERTARLGRMAEHTLISRNGHGFWLAEAGRIDEAILVLAEVHADCAERLGPDHLYTLGSLGNLAYVLGLRHGPASTVDLLARVHARLLDRYGERNRQTTKFEAVLREWRDVLSG
ncbi:tetratricopeptide repeat protein [Actinoplanes sp. M2I2]|uniref:NB-ARC domain-containing protein n=1 Tax=Actinoplanes sp. M2I2 TaxID=1734444 RepID=UPI002021BE86|nr:tetratricopeptide repeat protein [Actinoplanes sp. M2I2]